MSVIALLPETKSLIDRIKGAYIEGQHQATQSDTTTSIFNPATGDRIVVLGEAGPADVDLAVRSAHRHFEAGTWRNMRPADRERILYKFSEVIAAHGEELAQLESWNQGKSIHLARAVEVGASVEYIRYVAGLTTKITGLTLDVSIPFPPGARFNVSTRREPVGVVAGIAPWNFPMSISIWKILPALAAGCSIVLKPSEVTPLTAFRLAELAIEAGVPPGVFNVVNGTGPVTGEALVRHPNIAKISFTGSTAAGKRIGQVALDRMARFSLELGGKNPAVVLRDADLAKTIPGLLAGALFNSGQVCAAISRIYVDKAIYPALLDGMSAAIRDMKLGAGLDESTQVAPLASAPHRDKVNAHVAAARASGLDLIQGGDVPERGYFVSPTLALGADQNNALIREEVFGPVIALTAVDGADQAIHFANDTKYGLAASLWTESLSQAMDLIPRINAGTVWVNNHIPLDPNMPFGGFKESGLGRDFGPNSLDAFTEIKSVCIAY